MQLLPQYVKPSYNLNGTTKGGLTLIAVSPSGPIKVKPHSNAVFCAC